MNRIILTATLTLGFLTISCDQEPPKMDTGLVIKKWTEPVLSREDGLIADPTIIQRADSLVMYYTNYSLATDSITFGASWSMDGINWVPVSTEPGFRVFSGDPDSWDKRIETPEVTLVGGEEFMYYIGYPDSEDFTKGIYESEVGLAIKNHNGKFVRYQQEPVVPRGGEYDFHALTSPGVVFHNNTYFMVYTGWSHILEPGGFLGLTGATSPDGKVWEKHEMPVFQEVGNTHFETATEADVVEGPDGIFYMVFSAEGGIALARAEHPFGPWEAFPEFIITPDQEWESGEVVAPDMIIEGGKARIWYAGVMGSFFGSSIGYAEIDFPFDW